MSKHPPSVWIEKKIAEEPLSVLLTHSFNAYPHLDSEQRIHCLEYITRVEAQEMAERAREEGRKEVVCDAISEILDTMENDPSPARWDHCIARIRKLEASKPSPQGGGEKKEGSK